MPTVHLAAGEVVIRSHVNDIVGLLLPEHYWKEKDKQSSNGPTVLNDATPNSHSDLGTRPIPPSQMLGPSYALYSLIRNGKSWGTLP